MTRKSLSVLGIILKRKLLLTVLAIVVLAAVYSLAVFLPHTRHCGRIADCVSNMLDIGPFLRSVDDDQRDKLLAAPDMEAFGDLCVSSGISSSKRPPDLQCKDSGRPYGYCPLKKGADPSSWILFWDDPDAHRDSWRHKLFPALTSSPYSGDRPDPYLRDQEKLYGGTRVIYRWDAGKYAESLAGKPYESVIILRADGSWHAVSRDELTKQLSRQGVTLE